MARFIVDADAFGQPALKTERYKTFLQQQEFVKDIAGVINSQTTQYVAAIRVATDTLSREMARNTSIHIAALERSTECIVGALDKGFDHLSKKLVEGFKEVNDNLLNIECQLSELNFQMQNLAGIVDSRFKALIELQKITNLKLQQIVEFVRIPELQKQRIHHLENGLKFLKNAQIDPRRYSDALECLKAAEKLGKRDYVTLYNIGLIYLFSSEQLDLVAAEEYFLKAADYADDEIPSHAERSMNYFGEAKQNSAQFIKNIAANSYHFAAYAQYLNEKFDLSIKNANEAFKIDPNLKEALYNNALSYMALGNEIMALESISQLNGDHNYIIEVAFNPELAASGKIQSFLDNTRDLRKENLTKRLSEVISISKAGSPIFEKSKALMDELEDGTFLSVLTVSKKLFQ